MIEAEVLGKHLVVEGFKNIEVKDVNSLLNLIKKCSGKAHVQVMDATLIAGFEHIFFAVLNALKSFESGLNISKSLAIEILLFASGQDQIKKAIEFLGIKQSSSTAALVIVADEREEAIAVLEKISEFLKGERNHEVIELTEEKIPNIIETFNISEAEIEASMRESLKEAVKNVLIERAALLITQH